MSTHLVLLCALCALTFFWNLNAPPLFDHDEGAFSEATREMIERSDLISPTLNGEPRYDKPILVYWMQAAGVEIFGMNEFGVRFPSALAATLWVFATYFFARRFYSPAVGLVAAVVQATSLFVMVIGRIGTADALLNLFLALVFFDIYRCFDAADNPNAQKWSVLRAYLWLGLGFLTKGPVALLLPLGTAFLFAVFRRKWSPLFRLAINPVGWLLFVAVAAPWYVVQTMRDGGEFLRVFFLKHNLSRYGVAFEGHSGSVFYYVPVVFALILPYSHWLTRMLSRIRDVRRGGLTLYLWLWFGFVFVFFSLSSSKLPHYLLYGMTPVFILMASRRRERRFTRALSMLPVFVSLLTLFLLPWLIPIVESYSTKPDVLTRLADAKALVNIPSQVLIVLALIAVIALFLAKRIKTWRILPAAAIIQAIVFIGILIPGLGVVLQKPTYDAANYLRENKIENVVVWKLDAPSISFYRPKVTLTRAPAAGDVVVTKVSYLNELPGAEVLFQEGLIAIVRVREIAQ